MARPEWLRTFVAVYRSGSISDGARLRALSQPAASQQLAALERAVGTALFVRTRSGVVATERGRALYGEVAGALDQLETVLSGLDAGRVGEAPSLLRLGSSAEYFSYELVPRLAGRRLEVVARFGGDGELVERLERGELDLIVTSAAPPRRAVAWQQLGEKQFVLVCAPGLARRRPFASLGALARWLVDRPWVAYSQELPLTRRFWQAQLGRPFPSANLRLVAPDLRAVAAAVAAGIGYSLLPSFVCVELLADGRMVEAYPVADLVGPEPWFVSWRDGEMTRPAIAQLLDALAAPRPAMPG